MRGVNVWSWVSQAGARGKAGPGVGAKRYALQMGYLWIQVLLFRLQVLARVVDAREALELVEACPSRWRQ